MRLLPRLLAFTSILIASVGCDQVTKDIATSALRSEPTRQYLGDLFRLTWATNEGAFLSLGANLPQEVRHWVFTVGVGLFLLALAIYTLTNKKLGPWELSGYTLLLGGGASNWLDRARFDGRVVDFMNLGIGNLRTGIFNVADVVIIVGFGVLLLGARLQKPETETATV
jgi:signal peptidase II